MPARPKDWPEQSLKPMRAIRLEESGVAVVVVASTMETSRLVEAVGSSEAVMVLVQIRQRQKQTEDMLHQLSQKHQQHQRSLGSGAQRAWH